jgi:hypothetical protein
MMKYPIIRHAEKVARSCFVGIAIPHQPSLADGTYGPIKSEKVLKFNRKSLMRGNSPQKSSEQADPRLLGGEDNMIVPIGQPGSRERVEALASQYAAILESGVEVSPFRGG